MDVLVPLAWVVDPQITVRASLDQKKAQTEHAKKSINPFDAIALEQALRWHEAGAIETITVIHIGRETQGLRQALAMGAHRAVLIETNATLPCLSLAKTLQAWLTQHASHQIVLMGKQSSDDDQAQVGPMLSGLMGWSQGLFASIASIENDSVHITQELDSGLANIVCPIPSVITTDLRLNTPRHPSMLQIMQAKKTEIETVAPNTLLTLPDPMWQLDQACDVSMQRSCQQVQTQAELRLALEARGIAL